MEKRIISLIGGTPTVRLRGIEEKFALGSRLYAKLESHNPSGSVKDRAALRIITDAIASGVLSEGMTLIEASSGNMGISLAMLSAVFGYRAVIFMPENMSEERRRMIEKYGAKLILTPSDEGMMGAGSRAEKMLKNTKNGYTSCQFTNKSGVFAHFFGTGRELFSDCNGEIDTIVCGVGTAATLMGVGTFLKERLPTVSLVAVEPAESTVMSGGGPRVHSIEGIGAGFMPPLIDMRLVDRVVAVPSRGAIEMSRLIFNTEGISVGPSSGAALWAAIELSRESDRGKNIAVIFPDSGDRYLS